MAIYACNGVAPSWGRDVYIAPNAVVLGDVQLGDECSVWFGAVLRGDVFPIRFGARTNVQDNCVVHVTGGKAGTTVGDDVTIGHLALLHGCTVGSGTLVGMSSVLLDGCEIGDECVVAAGALVAPGVKIPSRSLVMGRPAKVVRAVTETDLAWVREAASLYVGYARDYRAGKVIRIDAG